MGVTVNKIGYMKAQKVKVGLDILHKVVIAIIYDFIMNTDSSMFNLTVVAGWREAFYFVLWFSA